MENVPSGFPATLEIDYPDRELDRLTTLDADGIIEIIKVTQSGMSTEQFSGIVAEWLDTAKDPRFDPSAFSLILAGGPVYRGGGESALRSLAERLEEFFRRPPVHGFDVNTRARRSRVAAGRAVDGGAEPHEA